MPANLSPEYKKAAELYRKASDPAEQLELLEEMLRTIPKHKETDKLQADLKRRIKETKQESQRGRSQKKRGGPSHHVESGGYPQVVVLGPPNSGKSALISTLCGVELEVGDYPYTTRVPRPVMMPILDVQVQLVDTPPIAVEHMDSWLTSIIRGCDEVLLVIDAAAPDILEGMEGLLEQLAKRRIHLEETPEAEESVGVAVLPTLLAATKIDLEGAGDSLEVFRDLYGERFEVLPVSVESREGLEPLRERVYQLLDRVRVYSKRPGQKPDYDEPFLLPRGSTVLDLARHIHRDMVATFKKARIWDSKEYAPGQWISRDYAIQDQDVIEIEA